MDGADIGQKKGLKMSLKYNEPPRRICTYCELRHHTFSEICDDNYMSDECKYFVPGKCFRCKFYNNGKPVEGICMAEDLSGEFCPNFTEEI